jgi:hypothetical protein
VGGAANACGGSRGAPWPAGSRHYRRIVNTLRHASLIPAAALKTVIISVGGQPVFQPGFASISILYVEPALLANPRQVD